jgi:hypothetical protein
LLTFLTWIPNIIKFILQSIITDFEKQNLWFLYLISITTPLHGFFNMLIYFLTFTFFQKVNTNFQKIILCECFKKEEGFVVVDPEDTIDFDNTNNLSKSYFDDDTLPTDDIDQNDSGYIVNVDEHPLSNSLSNYLKGFLKSK